MVHNALVAQLLHSEIESNFFFFFSRVALSGPRSVAMGGLHPCSHRPLFAIAPTHEWFKTVNRTKN